MKKTFCMTLALLFTLTLSACGKTDAPAPAVSGNAPSNTSVVAVPPSDGQQNQPISQAGTSCTFDPALFGGKLQSCAYAGNGTLFVLADKLGQFHTFYCVAVPHNGVSGPFFKTNSILLYKEN